MYAQRKLILSFEKQRYVGQKKKKKTGKKEKEKKRRKQRTVSKERIARAILPAALEPKCIFEIVATFWNTHLDKNVKREFYSSS